MLLLRAGTYFANIYRSYGCSRVDIMEHVHSTIRLSGLELNYDAQGKFTCYMCGNLMKSHQAITSPQIGGGRKEFPSMDDRCEYVELVSKDRRQSEVLLLEARSRVRRSLKTGICRISTGSGSTLIDVRHESKTTH